MSSVINGENNDTNSIFAINASRPAFRRRNKPKNHQDEKMNVNVQTAAHLRVQRDFAKKMSGWIFPL